MHIAIQGSIIISLFILGVWFAEWINRKNDGGNNLINII